MIILRGVTVGNNSVIGAGCVIGFDVPENSIVKRGKESYQFSNIRSN